MNRLVLFAALVLLLSGSIITANAQDAQQDRQQQTLLPEIDPQDIEIRSQFQARFPGLRRQPILGFQPRSRVYQIDPDRRPFIEDEEMVMASLPIGVLDRPEPPQYTPLGYADPKNGFARLGFGNYMSPEADVYAIARLNDRNRVSASFNHFSTGGHLDELTDSYRSTDLDLRSVHMLSDRMMVRMKAGVHSDFSHYPGMITQNGNPSDEVSRAEVFGFYGGSEINYSRTALSGFAFSVEGYGNQLDRTSELSTLEGAADEWGVKAGAEYSRLGENIQEVHRLRLNTSAGGINPASADFSAWSVTRLSAHYERLYNYQTEVKAGLGVAGVSDAQNDFSFYVTPDITVIHTLFSGLDLKGHFSGTPSHRNLADLYRENRFSDFNNHIQHQFEWRALAEAQIEPYSGTTVSGGISYQNIRNYLYYERNENTISFLPGPVERFYSPEFSNANIFKIYGGFSQDLRPDIIWIRADGFWQRPRLSNNEKIPFIESYSVKGTVAIRPFPQLVIEGWTEYAGRRNDSDGISLSSFILLGGRFEISLSENLGVYGKLVNLFDEEYELWRGYTERGFQGFVGITYLF